MALSILATADFHLGRKYAGYPEVQGELVEARFACLDRLVATANERRCELFLVAGDLFDGVGVAHRDVLRALESLRSFEGKLVALLPGNHDYRSPGRDPLWPFLEEQAGDALLVLTDPRPYPLAHYEIDACLYPGPCTRRHSDASAVGWVKEAPREPGIRHHVGVAHGSLAGFSPDFTQSYYPMETAQLLASGPDLWVIGHTHVRYPEEPSARDRVFIPGTPEPTGFDCLRPGSAWQLSLGDDRRVAAVAIETGKYRFLHEEVPLGQPDALPGLLGRHAGPEARRHLVKVRLSGRVPRSERDALAAAESELRSRLAWLAWQDEEVREELTAGAVDELWPRGTFPHRLLSGLLDDPECLEIAEELLERARG